MKYSVIKWNFFFLSFACCDVQLSISAIFPSIHIVPHTPHRTDWLISFPVWFFHLLHRYHLLLHRHILGERRMRSEWKIEIEISDKIRKNKISKKTRNTFLLLFSFFFVIRKIHSQGRGFFSLILINFWTNIFMFRTDWNMKQSHIY